MMKSAFFHDEAYQVLLREGETVGQILLDLLGPGARLLLTLLPQGSTC